MREPKDYKGRLEKDMPTLVLASSSPRRRELLTQAGFSFSIHPANIPEDPLPDEDPVAYVTRLAREKAEAVYRELTAGPHEPGPDGSQMVALGADTTVTLDRMILGKPENAADAERMLRLLSGRSHRVITGVAVVGPAPALNGSSESRTPGVEQPRREALAPHVEVAAEVTAVRFLTLSHEEIRAYIAGGEPMDKAGAYAIQGRAARWIPRIEGDYFNVVGLPLALVATLLQARGIAPNP